MYFLYFIQFCIDRNHNLIFSDLFMGSVKLDFVTSVSTQDIYSDFFLSPSLGNDSIQIEKLSQIAA